MQFKEKKEEKQANTLNFEKYLPKGIQRRMEKQERRALDLSESY